MAMTWFARLLLVIAITGCRKPEPNASPSEIVDQSSSLEALQRAFNAQRGHARFVALLAPS